MSKLTIGEFLAAQRRIKGYTQQQVADMLGVSNRTLSSWEQGRTYPDILILPALAEIYGISVDDITRGACSGELPVAELENVESSNYIDARNTHAANSVWLSGICLASPLFTSLTFICAYFAAMWAVVLCAALAVFSAIAAFTAVIFFNRSALNRTGAYLPSEERGTLSDKCSLAISLNTCRTLAVAGWAYFVPVIAGIILLCLEYTTAVGFRYVNLPSYAMLFPLIAGAGVLAASVIYKNIAVKKYGDERQNILQKRNRVLFLICLTAILPVLASVICVSEIRIYRYYTDIYSAPREEFLHTVQTVYIAEPMASLYGVEEGEVFLDFQSAHVGNYDYLNEDGYYHITGNLYCKFVGTGGRINIYYLNEDGNYKFALDGECYTGLGDIIEEYFDLEGNAHYFTTVGVSMVILKKELMSGSFALDKELVVGTPCYGLPISRITPFHPVVYNNGYVPTEEDGIETLRYKLYCDYFPLVMPIACIVSAVSLVAGCTVYFIMRKRIY